MTALRDPVSDAGTGDISVLEMHLRGSFSYVGNKIVFPKLHVLGTL